MTQEQECRADAVRNVLCGGHAAGSLVQARDIRESSPAVPAEIRSAAARTRLTDSERSALTLVAAGRSDRGAAHRLGVRPEVFAQYLRSAGSKLGTSSRATHVRAALMTGQIIPIELPGEAPDFTGAELRLLRAIAWHSSLGDIATAAGLHPSDVNGAAAHLVDKAGAHDRAHLVALTIAWCLPLSPSTELTETP